MSRGDTRLISAGPLQIEISEKESALRVALTGELDAATAESLGDALGDARGELVLDLRGLEFIDSSGIVCLVKLHQQAKNGELALRVVRPTGHVAKLLEVAGLDKVLPFVDQ